MFDRYPGAVLFSCFFAREICFLCRRASQGRRVFRAVSTREAGSIFYGGESWLACDVYDFQFYDGLCQFSSSPSRNKLLSSLGHADSSVRRHFPSGYRSGTGRQLIQFQKVLQRVGEPGGHRSTRACPICRSSVLMGHNLRTLRQSVYLRLPFPDSRAAAEADTGEVETREVETGDWKNHHSTISTTKAITASSDHNE